jgi:hypothetical protein
MEMSRLTNLSERRLRQLSAEGKCPKAIQGRYETAQTINQLFKYYQQDEEDHVGDEIKREELRKLKSFNDERADKLVPIEKVSAFHAKVIREVRDILRRKLEEELPIAMAGLDVPQARVFGRRLGDELIREFGKLGEGLKI